MLLSLQIFLDVGTKAYSSNAGPGSFLEATKLIPLLMKEDEGPAFDVVVPSLPNFGFSQGVLKVSFEKLQKLWSGC